MQKSQLLYGDAIFPLDSRQNFAHTAIIAIDHTNAVNAELDEVKLAGTNYVVADSKGKPYAYRCGNPLFASAAEYIAHEFSSGDSRPRHDRGLSPQSNGIRRHPT